MNPGGKNCKQWPCRESPGSCAEPASSTAAVKMNKGTLESPPGFRSVAKTEQRGRFQCQNAPVPGFEKWLQAGDCLLLLSVQSRPEVGRMLRWLKCQKLLEVIPEFFCDSQLHNWFFPICRSFLTAACKELYCWKNLWSSLSFTGAIFHLREAGFEFCLFILGCWPVFQFCVVDGTSGIPQ